MKYNEKARVALLDSVSVSTLAHKRIVSIFPRLNSLGLLRSLGLPRSAFLWLARCSLRSVAKQQCPLYLAGLSVSLLIFSGEGRQGSSAAPKRIHSKTESRLLCACCAPMRSSSASHPYNHLFTGAHGAAQTHGLSSNSNSYLYKSKWHRSQRLGQKCTRVRCARDKT